MSANEAISELTKSVQQHTDTTQNFLNEADERITAKEQDVEKAISNMSLLGNGSARTTVINAANHVSYELGSTFIHLKLPFKTTLDTSMFHLHIRGYAYAEGNIVDATIVRYCNKSTSSILNGQTKGSHTPTIYKGTDDYVYVRLTIADQNHLTFTVDTTRIGVGKLIGRGDIEVINSTKETL